VRHKTAIDPAIVDEVLWLVLTAGCARTLHDRRPYTVARLQRTRIQSEQGLWLRPQSICIWAPRRSVAGDADVITPVVRVPMSLSRLHLSFAMACAWDMASRSASMIHDGGMPQRLSYKHHAENLVNKYQIT
jgi:hypothetical protein